MSKERLEQCRADIKKLQEEETRIIKELEQDEPRIGDFGIFDDGVRVVVGEDVVIWPGGETSWNPTDYPYKWHGNIFDVLDDGPIVVGLTVEEAEHLTSIIKCSVIDDEIDEKVMKTLKRYREAINESV